MKCPTCGSSVQVEQLNQLVLACIEIVAEGHTDYDETKRRRYCEQCGAMAQYEDGPLMHKPDCIVRQAQAWMGWEEVTP